MFVTRSEPVRFDEVELRSLRLSTNSPTVPISDLPDGQARAAIAVHEEASGAFQVTVAVCSVEARAAVFYVYDGDLTEAARTLEAAETALYFAESMGFRFGDDMLATGDLGARGRAVARWRELVGLDDEGPGPAFGDVGEEVVDPAAGSAVLTLDRLASQRSGAGARKRPSLSKFRRDSATPPAVGAGALGRVQLVKRQIAPEADDASNLLLRLLAAF